MAATSNLKQAVTTWLPPLAGVALIGLFLSLANWQLERAAEKDATAALFDPQAPAVPLAETRPGELYRPVVAEGRYWPGRQVLIDNVIRESRLGLYVITPFELTDGRLLLVNRGWIEKPRHSTALPEVAVDDDSRRIEARIGRLPRVALRPEEAIEPGQEWPLRAVYPQLADIEAALGRNLDEPVLLLAPTADDGYRRDWQPAERGSMMHYGYAFQWSALALTVLVVMVWQLRKRRRRSSAGT